MRGLIYGDVHGSIYEWKTIWEQDKITDPLHFTDDTVLGIAVADALITCREQAITDDEGIVSMVALKLRTYGRRYPDAGYSRSFKAWLMNDDAQPYGSKTNGAIMRCTSAGWLARSPEDARRLGRLTAMPTHNHPEAMDAAALSAEIIYRLRMGEPVDRMHALLREHYRIPQLADIRPITEFDFSCKTTLPIAFASFYEAVADIDLSGRHDGYDIVSETVKNALSLGGDTDTNAAIAASFAEAWNAAWGFGKENRPWLGRSLWYEGHWEETEAYCTPDILDVVRRLDEAVEQICPLRICGEYVYRLNDRGEAVIVHYPRTMDGLLKHQRIYRKETYEIPVQLDGFKVTAIGPFAFHFGSGIPGACRVPGGMRFIGDYAFACYKNTVQLPDCVEAIGCRAFAFGDGIGNTRVPSQLTVIGAGAFQEVCHYPPLPRELEHIGKGAMVKGRLGWFGHECTIPLGVKYLHPQALDTQNNIFWVYRGSLGEAFCQTNGCEYYYMDPELHQSEQKRLKDRQDRLSRERQEAEKRLEEERSRQVQEDPYEYVEVSIQRYAGWREHAEEAGYVIDGLDRVFEKRLKK